MLKTERLILRPWREDDLEPFYQMCSDPKVMEFFPSTLSREESDSFAKRFANDIQHKGWGLWAVSVPGISDFIGFIGLSIPSFEAHFTPNVEVAWRLATSFWGHGYATEGAKEALRYGFEQLNLKEIVSFTSIKNKKSMNVMKKIGMHHDPRDDFDHPRLAVDHPLCRHVLYRLSKKDWLGHE